MSKPAGRRWMDVSERGTVLGMMTVVTVARLLGRRVAGLVIRFVAAWYVLFAPAVRRASRDYLRRVRGRAGALDVYRHVLTFAQVVTDRLFMVRGDFRPFRIGCHGEEHLRHLRDQRRGALLILAHMGSFEVLRALSRERDLPVNVLGYFQNARRLNAVLRRLDPSVDARLIEIHPGDPSFVFEVEERIARGEVVGTMGDRVGHEGKATAVPFLGSPAPFPTGPYLLAAALRCPVYLCFGMYRAPDRYDLYCEPFAPVIELPRGAAREPALQALAARFAARLEHYCRAYPDAWFNFYDFWNAA